MAIEVCLINTPKVEFDRLKEIVKQATGRRLRASDDMVIASDTQRFLNCLATMRDESAALGWQPHLFAHVSLSVLILADERDLLDVLECCRMPFAVTDTLARNVQCAVISGTLAQWRDAVKNGSSMSVEPSVRHAFNKLYSLFKAANLNVWGDCVKKPVSDNTFCLEDKRGR